uniref:Papilin n=1 Tax=Parasteatoda tepidariorum TaxID=114398 RepID=A0A2L2ZAT2_PARTP
MFILLGLVIVAFADECPSNYHYNDCGSACQITCENYKDPLLLCTRICVLGCLCDEVEGYVNT